MANRNSAGKSSQRKQGDKSTKQRASEDERRKDAAGNDAEDDDEDVDELEDDDAEQDEDDSDDEDEGDDKKKPKLVKESDVIHRINKAARDARIAERNRWKAKGSGSDDPAKPAAKKDEQLSTQLAAAQKQIDDLKLETLKFQIALEVGLPNPAKSAKRLVGEDEDELRDDAEEMLASMGTAKKQRAVGDPANPPATPQGKTGKRASSDDGTGGKLPPKKKPKGDDDLTDEELASAIQSGAGNYARW